MTAHRTPTDALTPGHPHDPKMAKVEWAELHMIRFAASRSWRRTAIEERSPLIGATASDHRLQAHRLPIL